jgi:hypothetical protein
MPLMPNLSRSDSFEDPLYVAANQVLRATMTKAAVTTTGVDELRNRTGAVDLAPAHVLAIDAPDSH